MKVLGAFVKRVLGSPFGVTLVVFVLAQLAFLVVVKTVELPENVAKKGAENAQTAFLLLTVHILVAINTIVFLAEIGSFALKAPSLHQVTGLLGRYLSCVVVLVVSVLISGFMIHNIASTLWSPTEPLGAWAGVLKANEWLSLILFGSFLVADLSCLSACRLALAVPNMDAAAKARIEEFRGQVKLFCVACDGPGLFGIALITVISTALYSEVSGYYWHGFVAGAIGLHIAFSQTALAVVSIWK